VSLADGTIQFVDLFLVDSLIVPAPPGSTPPRRGGRGR
jgi:hypothetical protein